MLIILNPKGSKVTTREAYFYKAELARAVLPLLWESDKRYYIVWLDSGATIHSLYCLTNLCMLTDSESDLTNWDKKPKQNQTSDLVNAPKSRRSDILPARLIN